MRKIAVVTGSRAEYGLLKPVMQEIQNNANLELFIIATGMHLVTEKGYTVDEIKKDFYVAVEIDMEMYDDKPVTLVRALGTGIKKFAAVFFEVRPDIVLVLGDRNEPLAASIAAAQLDIPVAHIHGGDITSSGTIDESIRYAITEFSHIHFVATKKSADRLEKVGEQPGRIHVTGSPAIDEIKNMYYLSKKEIMEKYDLDGSKKYVIALHNPVTIDPKGSLNNLKASLSALLDLEIQVVAIHPNADRGSTMMIQEINKCGDNPNFKIFKNVNHDDFLNLLKYAEFIIGNSTSGVIEAPMFETPVLNIGERQISREYFGYVKFLKADKNIIKKEAKIILNKGFILPNRKNPYGDGTASKKIVDVLVNTKLDFNLIKKEKCL